MIIEIHDSGKDYGYNRYNARSGGELIVSTNSVKALIEAVREYLEEPEPDVETIIEERRRPTAREDLIMERGIELREARG